MMMEFLGRKVTVVDSTEDLYAKILPRDYVAGTECDPFNCTAANAIKRKPGVAAVKVLNAVSFVVFDDSPEVAVRYWNYGAHLSAEKIVKRHDNKKLAIPDGGLDIRLKPPTSTNRLLRSMNKADAKKQRTQKNESAARRAKKRARGVPPKKYRTSLSGIRASFIPAISAILATPPAPIKK